MFSSSFCRHSPLCLASSGLSYCGRLRTSLFRLGVLAGLQLLLELLPERNSVGTAQGRHPRAFASGARRPVPPLVQPPTGAADAAREPLATVEVPLPQSDRQLVLWPVLLDAKLNGLVSAIRGALWPPGFHPTFPHSERNAARPIGGQPLGARRHRDGWGSPVRPSELALRVRLRRPARNRPPTSSEVAGGTSFRFTPGPRSATRSMG